MAQATLLAPHPVCREMVITGPASFWVLTGIKSPPIRRFMYSKSLFSMSIVFGINERKSGYYLF
jgi:hypothetical protein